MKIYQVEAYVTAMTKEQLNHELGVVDAMLALAGDWVFCAELKADFNRLNIFLCAKSKQAINDVLEASDFAVKKIQPIGTPHETYMNFGGWRTPAAQTRRRLKNYLVVSPSWNAGTPSAAALQCRETHRRSMGVRKGFRPIPVCEAGRGLHVRPGHLHSQPAC